jgi:hypothetical protein
MSVFDMNVTGMSGTRDRVTNAIAMASQRTGMDFGYLLGQAKLESSMNPTAKASTSSATGLYQFLDQSWLSVVHDHGSEYGMSWAADAIKQGSNGKYYVPDSNLRQQILDMRNHPETASVMAAEFAGDNKDYLESKLGRTMDSTDLYMAHFLGKGGATKFLTNMSQSPDAAAASAFPAAARSNRSVFYDKQGNARSYSEIRDLFATKLAKGAQSAMNIASSNDLPAGSPTVQPADYVRLETERLAQTQPDPTSLIRPQPEMARLAYLMLATFGR